MKNKGFTLVEVLLIVLILCVVGGIGYYVYSQNNDNSESEKNTNQSTQNTSSPTAETEKNTESDEKQEASYLTTPNGIRYEQPAGWSYTPSKEKGYPDIFQSPDYSFEDIGVYAISNGAEIKLYPADQSEIGVDEAVSSINAGEWGDYSVDAEKVSVGERDVVVYDCSHINSSQCYAFLTKDAVWFVVSFTIPKSTDGDAFSSNYYYQTYMDFVEKVVELN